MLGLPCWLGDCPMRNEKVPTSGRNFHHFDTWQAPSCLWSPTGHTLMHPPCRAWGHWRVRAVCCSLAGLKAWLQRANDLAGRASYLALESSQGNQGSQEKAIKAGKRGNQDSQERPVRAVKRGQSWQSRQGKAVMAEKTRQGKAVTVGVGVGVGVRCCWCWWSVSVLPNWG